MVHTQRLTIRTSGQGDAHDLTDRVRQAVRDAAIAEGIVTVFVIGSTAAITTIEFEPGAIADLNRVLESLAPRNGDYQHHRRWGDDNGSSHVRAALLGPSVSVPVVGGEPALGTWQQVMLLECDTGPRSRIVVVQIAGDASG